MKVVFECLKGIYTLCAIRALVPGLIHVCHLLKLSKTANFKYFTKLSKKLFLEQKDQFDLGLSSTVVLAGSTMDLGSLYLSVKQVTATGS